MRHLSGGVRADGGTATVPDRPGPVVVQSDGQIVSANEAALVLLGADAKSDVLGRSLDEFVVPDSRDVLGEQLDRVRDGGTRALGLTVSVEGLDGVTREVIAVSSPVEWDGAPGVESVLLDVTGDGEQALVTLREHAMHEAPVGISIADAREEDLPLVYVNDGFVELTGYPREEIIGRNCRFLQGEATRDEPVDRMRAAIENGDAVSVQLRNYRKDGTMFWNRVTLSPVENHEGEVTHYLGFQEDISDTKVFEHESSVFEAQVAAAGQAMFITDREGTIEYVNPAFEQLTGYSAEEAIGREPSILTSGQQSDAVYRDLWETIEAGDVWEGTLWNRTKAGEYYQTEETIVPVTDDRGEITNFVAIQNEITRDEIRDQILEVLDRVLRHNIRNAVTAISGFATALEEDLDDREHRSMVERIRSVAADLESISDRTRPIFELFWGVYEPDPWPVGSVVDVIDATGQAYPEAEITVDCQAPRDELVTSGRAVSIALTEAVENAIVHNDRESPTVEVRIRATPEPSRLHVDIADDGPGVPTEEWEIVQSGVEQPLSHTSGIGLWLVNWTVTAIGGKATMAENEPRGTVMRLEIPLEETSRSETAG